MVPNQSEDKILAKYFKHFDLDNTGITYTVILILLILGYCKFGDFVRVLERIGVILGKIINIQNVFNYYDTEKTGFIDYKKFSYDLFNSKPEQNKTTSITNLQRITTENRSKQGFESNMMKDSHFIKLHNFLNSNGSYGLMHFYKEFKV